MRIILYRSQFNGSVVLAIRAGTVEEMPAMGRKWVQDAQITLGWHPDMDTLPTIAHIAPYREFIDSKGFIRGNYYPWEIYV